MKILILGGAGFLGLNLVRRCLSEPGSVVTVLDSLDPMFHPNEENLAPFKNQIRFIQGDIRNQVLLEECVLGQDLIFNCAAQASHTLSIRHPVLDAEVNCAGSLKLLEAVRRYAPLAAVVFPSSTTTYGKAREHFIDENHPEHPLDIYSADKAAAENYYEIYHSLHGLKTVCLRFANLYGPFGKANPEYGFINHFIHRAWHDDEIQIYGKGHQIRNVMYADDAAQILFEAAFLPALYGKTLLATSPFHLSVLAIAEAILRVFGKGRITHVPWPELRNRIEVDTVRFSGEKLKALTGWQAAYDFETGLQETKLVMEKFAETSFSFPEI